MVPPITGFPKSTSFTTHSSATLSLLPQAASHHLHTCLLDQVLRMSGEKVLGGERTFEDRTIMVEELPATDCAILSWWGPPHACAHMLATFGPWRDEAPWKGPRVWSARDASRPHLSCCWHRAQQSLIPRGPCPVEIRKKKFTLLGHLPFRLYCFLDTFGERPQSFKSCCL